MASGRDFGASLKPHLAQQLGKAWFRTKTKRVEIAFDLCEGHVDRAETCRSLGKTDGVDRTITLIERYRPANPRRLRSLRGVSAGYESCKNGFDW
jgi:hypothetical protein